LLKQMAEETMRDPIKDELCVAIGFGPGLMMEGMLLSR
jgi:hypothetical protein